MSPFLIVGSGNLMKMVLQKLFIALVIILFFISGCARTSKAFSTKDVSKIDIKYQLHGKSKKFYQVTCDGGQQHRIIFNPAEQDYKYFSLKKGDFIKLYDNKFNDLIYFGRWVCRNE